MLAERRKIEHGELLNKLIAKGRYLRCEDLGYVAWQKCFPRSDRDRAPGAFERARRKAESASGVLYEYSTRATALSQVSICGKKLKKPLSQRRHVCACGADADRDLFSALLGRYVSPVGGTDQLDLVGAREGYGPRRQDIASNPEAERAGLAPGKPRVTRVSPAWEAFAGTGCQAPRESCPRATFRRSGAGKAKTCCRARHFARAPRQTWEPRMRRLHHTGSSSAASTATPAQAGGETTSCKAGIPGLQGREDVKKPV